MLPDVHLHPHALVQVALRDDPTEVAQDTTRAGSIKHIRVEKESALWGLGALSRGSHLITIPSTSHHRRPAMRPKFPPERGSTADDAETSQRKNPQSY
jgi:hypothetical protein